MQCHSQVDRPPRVVPRVVVSICTRAMAAVVSVSGAIKIPIRVAMRADLVRWTIQSNVYVEARTHWH